MVGYREEMAGVAIVICSEAGQLFEQGGDACLLCPDLAFDALVRVQDVFDQIVTNVVGEARQQIDGYRAMLVGGKAHAETELGIVLKQGIRLGGAATFDVPGPRRGGLIAAIDRGAAGGVCDQEPFAEELRDQIDVRRLTAAGAGAGELEQWLQELQTVHGRKPDTRVVVDRQCFGKRDVSFRIVQDRRLRHHVDGAVAGALLVLDRAGLDAKGAAGAVFGIDLQRVARLGKAARISRR